MQGAIRERLERAWAELYPDNAGGLASVMDELERLKSEPGGSLRPLPPDWYKDGIVYSAYVDRFATDFDGMARRLEHLAALGADILWLLPCLESPMVDQGFDVSDYEKIRPSLLGAPGEAAFDRFMARARDLGIHIIFDLTVNHCSDRHPWFVEASSSRSSKKRDWFFWSDDGDRFSEARLLFKGMVDSNWEYSEATGQYYFHRFYPCQPDLDYHRPEVLMEMLRIMIRWRARGMSGFRLDAVPFIWKDEGTDCENRPRAHAVIRFWRAALDYVAPNTLLLAEACQPPSEVVRYFGEGDECQGAYHFPMMPMIFHVLASADSAALEEVLSPEVTPPIPEGCAWFTFLRCHDELTLEMVTPEQRRFLYENYCRNTDWDFRSGEGISARLFDLFQGDTAKVCQAFCLLFSLPGTPIIYYGDEFAMGNDAEFFRQMKERTGFADSRFLVRGAVDWETVREELSNPASPASVVFHAVEAMIEARKSAPALRAGELEFLEHGFPGLLAFRRYTADESVLVLHNLGDRPLSIAPDEFLVRRKNARPEEARRKQAGRKQAGRKQARREGARRETILTEEAVAEEPRQTESGRADGPTELAPMTVLPLLVLNDGKVTIPGVNHAGPNGNGSARRACPDDGIASIDSAVRKTDGAGQPGGERARLDLAPASSMWLWLRPPA